MCHLLSVFLVGGVDGGGRRIIEGGKGGEEEGKRRGTMEGKGRRQKGREKRIVAGYPHLDSGSLELKAGFFSHAFHTADYKENSHTKMYPEEHLCS